MRIVARILVDLRVRVGTRLNSVRRGYFLLLVPPSHLNLWFIGSRLFLPTWRDHRRSSISTIVEGLTLNITSRELGHVVARSGFIKGGGLVVL